VAQALLPVLVLDRLSVPNFGRSPSRLRVFEVSFCFSDRARCRRSGHFLCSWGYMNTLPLPCSPFLKDLHESSPRVPIRPCCKQSPCVKPPHLIPISAERSGRGSQPQKHKTQRNLRCAAVQIFITCGPQPPSAALLRLIIVRLCRHEIKQKSWPIRRNSLTPVKRRRREIIEPTLKRAPARRKGG
jgi:hypothetical protein